MMVGRTPRTRIALGAAAVGLSIAIFVVGRGLLSPDENSTLAPPAAINAGAPVGEGRMSLITGRTFRMGAPDHRVVNHGVVNHGTIDQDADARPGHDVWLDDFWIDRFEVTNDDFARFVEETNCLTTAEQRGSSEVFDPIRRSWRSVAGADWRHPRGPDDSIMGREQHPVVHVSWHDARAYCRWALRRLPTEAEWECAAKGGRHGADFPWGYRLDSPPPANVWQGLFPLKDEGADGYVGLAPVGRFAANPFDLFDTAGNVREWCADGYAPDYYQHAPQKNPGGAANSASRIVRGGSWLTPEAPQPAFVVWRRQHMAPSHTDNQTGFRTAEDR